MSDDWGTFHVYYGCNGSKNRDCKGGYINEIDLIKQFEELMETINIDEIGIKEKIKNEVQRFKRFNQILLNSKDKIEVGDVDIRNYCKYILRNGTDGEKRELLGCLRGQIKLSSKRIAVI